jgi:ATP phosphoribosyltransferase
MAIAKGRLQSDALGLLRQIGIAPSDEGEMSRRLSIEDQSGKYCFLFVKPADVPVYVQHGVADCGIVGHDVLLESTVDVLQPLDLSIGSCRMVVAALAGAKPNGHGMLKVATKYPRVATRHFGLRGQPVEIISLSGSVELAPVLGLADCIVDLVETGQTLRANGLVVVDEVFSSVARMIVNRASYQLKADAIMPLIDSLKAVTCEGAKAND